MEREFDNIIDRKFDSDPILAVSLSRERIEDLKVEAKMNARKKIIGEYLKHAIFRLGEYWCTYVDDERSQCGRKRIKSKTREGLEEKILDLYEAKNRKEDTTPVTFGATYFAWRSVHDQTLCGNSVRRYETDYQRFFAGSAIMDVPIAQITKSDIEAFIARRVYELKLCPTACKKLYEYTKDTFSYVLEKELIDRDPMFAIKCTSFYAKCTNSVRSKKEQVFSKYYTYDAFSMDEKKKLMAAGSIVSKRKTASN